MFPLWRLEYLYKLPVILLQVRSVFSPLLFIQSFLYISMGVRIFYIFCYTLQYYSYCSIFGHQQLFQEAPESLWHNPMIVGFVFRTSLLSGKIRCSRLMLHISCLRPRTSHFPKASYLLLLENGIRNQGLGTKCAHWYWVWWLPGSPHCLNKELCVNSLMYANISVHPTRSTLS